MVATPITIPAALQSIAEALLIGLLVGVQRENIPGIHPGLRDFLVIGLTGGICGVLQLPWLTASALLSITAVMLVFHFETRAQRSGVTTELAGIATFCLAFLTATPGIEFGAPMAVGGAILVVAFLEMKLRLQKLIRETISESEFNDTLRFLAVVLVIYPLLPPGSFGPYNFFSPRQVWIFVILISSISYIGYFLQKFFGESKGLLYTSVLGGLASTTAATLAFARSSRATPDHIRAYWQATVIANTVQFPRTMLVLWLVNVDLALGCLWPLVAMTLAGLGLSLYLAHSGKPPAPDPAMKLGNPFSLFPALKFGALFAAVLYIGKAAAVQLGPGSVYVTSVIGGLVDVATVAVSASDLLLAKRVNLVIAEDAVLLALASNIIFKVVLAASSGTLAFTRRLCFSFALMLGAGAVAWAAFRLG